MADLQADFQAAAAAAQTLPTKPDNDTLLKLYAYYKQSTVGDVVGSRPGMMDFVGRAKYDAWTKLQGTSSDAAKQSYIDLVNGLVAE